MQLESAFHTHKTLHGSIEMLHGKCLYGSRQIFPVINETGSELCQIGCSGIVRKVPANETLNTTEEVNSSSRDIKKYAKFEDEIMNNERIA